MVAGSSLLLSTVTAVTDGHGKVCRHKLLKMKTVFCFCTNSLRTQLLASKYFRLMHPCPTHIHRPTDTHTHFPPSLLLQDALKAAKAKIAAENLGITLHEPSGTASGSTAPPANPGVVACPACQKTSEDAWLSQVIMGHFD